MPQDVNPWMEFRFVWGVYERSTLRQCLAVLRPADVVVDAGAHLGYYTRHFARAVGRAGKVFAIEPHPANVRLLKVNTASFPQVDVIEAAITDATGSGVLRETADSDTHSLIPLDGPAPVGYVQVSTVRLDDVLQGIIPKLIKIDIEGSELLALRGMAQTIARTGHLYLVIEFVPQLLRAAGHDPMELLNLLQAQGFNVRALNSPISQSNWQNLWCEKVSSPGR